MNLQINEKKIPGTVLDRASMGNVTGLEFLGKIFYISDGIMLTQIREIAGIDGTTLQNWTKRGWVENPKSKKYNIDQLAHILIINMLRSCMRLDKIAFLVSYINGRVYDRSDDIIPDSRLYDYICRILDRLMETEVTVDSAATLKQCIGEVTEDYEEKIAGAKKRLTNALEIIIIAYYASIIKEKSDEMIDSLMNR
ncbi:MAG: DUF1836 domain-containing protein [Clostridia bacterium]|nr:DUF1836 domain-containing protein [Clostridia bacterium]